MPPFLHDGEGIWPPIIGVDSFRSSSMKDESRSKYRSKETLERRVEVLQLFFCNFSVDSSLRRYLVNLNEERE